MSRLFAPANPEDIELHNNQETYSRKTVLWNVDGESEAREGTVIGVFRDQKTQKIMLNVEYDSECSEQGYDTIKIKTKIPADITQLKHKTSAPAEWQITYPA